MNLTVKTDNNRQVIDITDHMQQLVDKQAKAVLM
jgi:hypothetical protein